MNSPVLHVTEDVLVGLDEGFLSDEEEASARAHLASCSECSALLRAWQESESQVRGAGTTWGRFVVLEEIGAGSVGRVFAAWDPVLNRKVALKVLRAEVATEKAQLLLLREAQALARLTHPNVVGVYDAGSERGVSYLAMEFVEGTHFRQWQQRRPRSVVEIVHAFQEAARGLSAAHQVGLLHRDFKLSNLLIGEDDRLRVADFGLAVLANQVTAIPEAHLQANVALTTSLTQTGALVGTPAYLAPEVWQNEKASEASDQFSFAAALFEALTGTLPFTGPNVAERLDAIRRGPIWPTGGLRISNALKAAVNRGLQFDPRLRFSSMNEFEKSLVQVERRRSLQLATVGLTAVALVVASITGIWWERNRSRCTGLAVQLDDVWGSSAKAKLASHVARTDTPQLVDSLIDVLDAWEKNWVSTREQVCRLEAESGSLVRPQIICLESQRRLMAAVVGELVQLSSEGLPSGLHAVAALPQPRLCLSETQHLAVPESAPWVEVEPALAAHLLGHLDDARNRAEAVIATAQAKGSLQTEAAAMIVLAEVHYAKGHYPEAEAAYRAAIVKAERAQANVVTAQGWLRLAWLVGVTEGRLPEAFALTDLAEAVSLSRGRPAQVAEAQVTRAELLNQRGDFEQALTQARQAQVSYLESYGADSWAISKPQNVEGEVLKNLHRNEEALEAFKRAEATALKGLPKTHPHVLASRDDQALTLIELGRLAEAEAIAQSVLEIKLSQQPDKPSLASNYLNLGDLQLKEGKIAQALASNREALRRAQLALPENSPLAGLSMANIAECLLANGEIKESLAMYAQSIATLTKARGPTHPLVAGVMVALAQAERKQAAFTQALAHLEQAAQIYQQRHGTADLFTTLALEAEVLLALKQPARALVAAQRALELDTQALPPDVIAPAQFALAKVLIDAHGDEQRAHRLCVEASAHASESLRGELATFAQRHAWPWPPKP